MRLSPSARPAARLSVLLLLAACQPQARRLLLLDLALSDPVVLNGTARPWVDAGYTVRYRRFYPHLTRGDLPQFRTLVLLLGREPEAPSDALTAGDLALLDEWVRRGGVVVLGYGGGGADRPGAGRRDQPPRPRDARAAVPPVDHTVLGRGRARRHTCLPHGGGTLDAAPRRVGARTAGGARRAAGAAAGPPPRGAAVTAARASRRSEHHRAAAHPGQEARAGDERARLAAPAGVARLVDAVTRDAGRAARAAARRHARF